MYQSVQDGVEKLKESDFGSMSTGLKIDTNCKRSSTLNAIRVILGEIVRKCCVRVYCRHAQSYSIKNVLAGVNSLKKLYFRDCLQLFLIYFTYIHSRTLPSTTIV